MNINELKLVVAEMLDEAKKRKDKAEKLKSASGEAKNAYGFYEEVFDFSPPLGGYNLYRQQGQVNWGPYTSAGPTINQNFANPNTFLSLKEEQAVRSVVREVIQNGLVPAESAWAPMMEQSRTEGPHDNIWEACVRWYEQHKQENPVPEGGPKKKTNIEKTKYGPPAESGLPKDAKVKKPKAQTKNGRSA